nr:RecName: Full=Unknown protein CP 41 from 2D-PAGE [Clostridium pasteurianum]
MIYSTEVSNMAGV